MLSVLLKKRTTTVTMTSVCFNSEDRCSTTRARKPAKYRLRMSVGVFLPSSRMQDHGLGMHQVVDSVRAVRNDQVRIPLRPSPAPVNNCSAFSALPHVVPTTTRKFFHLQHAPRSGPIAHR